ncbi:2-octaprenyl-6-methoxyphenyl hydroxylase [Actinobacillus pleuropneumoniae]|uniref:2-octaprenyl-6-methoxyphenyl hydroxylase n=1 Tax=Actinobacillus pleuropneumoniae TaxID=715 RepID=UPI001EEF3115|nr:2-octaprenyl-6-methoxyphenyl hydroxylase [Actinobacillus pleuropneumoniae]UKH20091.1 2-octaprenyl-6-methoxyphenyl hydroxylase [Actinobacillus pleuropneumoniae]UPA21905.1 2-octaprenyl-6-methoxyphenyl hydroxylase [Actinobacillus pleuropneumoniae]
MAEQFDVVIVGGAVTGSVLALALSSLSQHKMRIAIVEKQLPDYVQQGGFDARSIALAQGSLQKFAQIRPLAGSSLAEQIQQIATPIQQIQVSDLGHFGKTTLKASELNLAQLGVVVELAKLGKNLTACIEQQPNIHWFCPNQIVHFERLQTEVLLRLQNGERLRTQLMVAADGIQSQIALQCGVETELLKDYQQSALIANVEISEPHQGQAFERFTTQGPLALLPLSDNRMSLVWCVKQAEDLLSLTDEDFLSQLQLQFGWTLGKFERVSKRFVYLLTSQKAQSHIHHRLAIVGNAAQLLHPVAGQGFNLGMRDLFTLAQLLAKAFAQGKDLGAFALLNQFEQARKQDQAQIISLTSGLISLFSCDFLPLQAVRNLGLFAISHSKLLRENIANKALGWQ